MAADLEIDIGKSLDNLIKLNEQGEKLAKTLIDAANAMSSASGKGAAAKNTNDLANAVNQLSTAQTKANSTTKTVKEFNEAEYEARQRLKMAIDAQKKAINEKIKLDSVDANSMTALGIQYARNTAYLNGMSKEWRETTEEGKRFVSETNEMREKMMSMNESIGNHTLSVGNYAKGTKQLNASVGQILREMPNAAMSANLFFMSISNNMAAVFDSIKSVREENAKLKAEGQASTPVWKQLGMSLFGMQAIMMLGVTLLTQYGGALASWIGQTLKGVFAISSLAKAEELHNKKLADTILLNELIEKQYDRKIERLKNQGRTQREIDAAELKKQEAIVEGIKKQIQIEQNLLDFREKKANKNKKDTQDAINQGNYELAAYLEKDQGELDADVILQSAKVKNLQNSYKIELENLQDMQKNKKAAYDNTFDLLMLELNSRKDYAERIMNDESKSYTERKNAARIYYDTLIAIARAQKDEDIKNGEDAVVKNKEFSIKRLQYLEDQTEAYKKLNNEIIKNQLDINSVLISSDKETQKQLAENADLSAKDRLLSAKSYYNNLERENEISYQNDIISNRNKELSETDRIKRSKANMLEYQKILFQISQDSEAQITENIELEITKRSNAYSRQIVQSEIETNNRIQSEAKTQEDVTRIRKEGAEKSFQITKDYLQNEISNLQKEIDRSDISIEEKISLKEKLAQTEKKLSDETTENYISNLDKQKSALAKFAEKYSSEISQTTNILSELNSTQYENSISNIEAETKAVEKEKEDQLSLVKGNSEKEAAVEAAYNAKIEALNKKKAQQEYKLQLWQQKMSALQAAINTALAVTKFLSQGDVAGAIAAGVLGAIEVGIILSKKISPPALAKGTKDAKEGIYRVGEAGRELADINGKTVLFDKETITYLPEHAKVYSNAETEKILKNPFVYPQTFTSDVKGNEMVNQLVGLRKDIRGLRTKRPVVNVYNLNNNSNLKRMFK